MIKFFRKIRQKLLSENLRERDGSIRAGKFSKYLLYAIGEIILVVIGILIALQINTWNEERKAKEKEGQLIEDLHNEFQKNYDQLLVDIKRLEAVEQSNAQLLALLQNPNPSISEVQLNRLISKGLSTPTWNPSFFVMEELKKSGGFAQLNNTKLKNALLDWERYYSNLREVEGAISNAFNRYLIFLIDEGAARNVDAENEDFNISRSILPKKNTALLKDYRFENHVDDMYISSAHLMNTYLVVRDKIESLLVLTKATE
ncbi:MAG: DUF6090 family protein [Bacteroidota bacterium]